MKNLLLITVLLVLAATKLMAQNNDTIEIKKNETNQFKIVANEEMDVNLKFNLLKEDAFNVVILDKNQNIVFSKIYHKEGENKVAFTVEGEEQYTVRFINKKQQNFIITPFVKN